MYVNAMLYPERLVFGVILVTVVTVLLQSIVWTILMAH